MNHKKKYLAFCLTLICGLFILGCSGCTTENNKNDEFKGATFVGFVLYDGLNSTVVVPETDVSYKVITNGHGAILNQRNLKDKLLYVEGTVRNGVLTISHLEKAEE